MQSSMWRVPEFAFAQQLYGFCCTTRLFIRASIHYPLLHGGLGQLGNSQCPGGFMSEGCVSQMPA